MASLLLLTGELSDFAHFAPFARILVCNSKDYVVLWKRQLVQNVDRLFVMEMGDVNGGEEKICIKYTRLGGDTVIHSFLFIVLVCL